MIPLAYSIAAQLAPETLRITVEDYPSPIPSMLFWRNYTYETPEWDIRVVQDIYGYRTTITSNGVRGLCGEGRGLTEQEATLKAVAVLVSGDPFLYDTGPRDGGYL